MRKIILIGGDLASGKSTYSRYLSDKFNLTVINKDILKEIIGDMYYASCREENIKLSRLSFEMIKYFIKVTKCDIIIESNFKDYEMEELKQFLPDNDILSLHFTGDDELLHDRFLKRLPSRHYVHKAQDFTNIEDMIETQTELRSVKYIGEVIRVDVGRYNNLTDDVELTQKIEEFLKR